MEAVSLFIDDMDGVDYASNNEIHTSARYINGYIFWQCENRNHCCMCHTMKVHTYGSGMVMDKVL